MAVDRRQVGRAPGPTNQSGLADLIDRILDKGLVIDAWVRISLVGIELITIEARVVVASVDTYLKYAEAIAQTALAAEPQGETHVDQIPTDDEVAAYLNDHPEGVRSSDLEHYFGISRNEVEQIVQRLASGPRVRRDEKQRDRLLPIIQSENGRRQITDGSRQRESNKQEESGKEQEPAGNR